MFSVRVTDRYFFWDTLKTFLLILGCFFALFFLIDYSSRSSAFHLKGIELAIYYYHLFIRRLEVLIPFALLVAAIRVFCQANTRYELSALMASGISLKRACVPVVVVGALATAGLYLTNEFLLPDSMHTLQRIEELHSVKNQKRQEHPVVHRVALPDGSQFLYRSYDLVGERFQDIFWIRTFDDVYRIKSLRPQENPTVGVQVEHFQRNAKGEMILVEAAKSLVLADLHFDPKTLDDVLISPGDRSLTALWKNLPPSGQTLTMEQAQVASAFYRKMVMPWLGLLTCLAPCSFCVRFRRPVPVFFLYCGFLAVLVLAYLWLSAGSILAQSQVLPPTWTLVAPMAAGLCYVSWRWCRL